MTTLQEIITAICAKKLELIDADFSEHLIDHVRITVQCLMGLRKNSLGNGQDGFECGYFSNTQDLNLTYRICGIPLEPVNVHTLENGNQYEIVVKGNVLKR